MVSVDLRPGERNGGVAMVLRGELEVAAALGSAGPIERRQLAGLVHVGRWGPGQFRGAAVSRSWVTGVAAVGSLRQGELALEGPAADVPAR